LDEGLKIRYGLGIDAVGHKETYLVFCQIHLNADRVLRRSIIELHRIFQQFVGNEVDSILDFSLPFLG